MFNKFKNQNYNQQYQNYQPPFMENQYFNSYDLSRIDEQINELKRMNTDLLRRITRLENYLGIRSESDASNFN